MFPFTSLDSPENAPSRVPESPEALAQAQDLKAMDAKFDEALGLIWGDVPDIHYHTILQVGAPIHATRESASYAFALFESREEWRIQRGNTILRRLVELQDACKESRTYGIWSWFYEEPLEKMSPPDWNWADFVGTQLIQTFVRSGDRIDPDLKDKVADAIGRAARSIIRRNVGMDYTNIAIMGTYVTVMAGEILGDREILDYGKERLRRFAQFTREWGGFPEYNSPNYAIVALTEVSRMIRDFRAPEDLAVVDEIHDLLWREIAWHWHVPSGQWAGPHSRAYQTLLSPSILGFLQRGLGNHVSLMQGEPPSFEVTLLPIRCPEPYLMFFAGEQPTRTRRQPILAGAPALEATTYLDETFAVSSVERGSFWNQARAVLAYARGREGASALHLRFLRDGYDYSSANVIASQEGADVLAAIGFANDGGDVHCSLDRIRNATIRASDWRLRFELQGDVRPPELPSEFSTADEIVFQLGDRAWVGFRIPWVTFGEAQPRWEITRQGNKTGLDLVLYQGPSREFVFDASFPCALGLGLSLRASRAELTRLSAVRSEALEDLLALEWPVKGRVDGRAYLNVAMPILPRKEQEIIEFAREIKVARS